MLMKHSEIVNEIVLYEGLLDSIKQSLGNKVDSAVSVVNNTSAAMQVFYKIGSNPQYLESITFLLKKNIKQKLKNMSTGPVLDKFKSVINRIFPPGRSFQDFFKCILIVCAMNAVSGIVSKLSSFAIDQAKDSALSQAKDLVSKISQQFANVDGILSGISNASGIFQAFKALGIANHLIFELLSSLNKKISSLSVTTESTEELDLVLDISGIGF